LNDTKSLTVCLITTFKNSAAVTLLKITLNHSSPFVMCICNTRKTVDQFKRAFFKVFRLGTLGAFISAALTLGFGMGVQAQVQRSFLNTGFESPVIGSACYVIVYDNAVPFWATTSAVNTPTGSCSVIPSGTTSGMIELWSTGFQSVPSRDGSQFAELNAYQSAALYQNICITNGESVSWALSHRGRNGLDTMAFVLGDSPASLSSVNIATTALTGGILQASTDTAGTGTIVSCQNGSSVQSTTACTVATTNTWADYKGVFTWNGTSSIKSVGFGAISAAGGISTGNFLDAITLTLKPYLEFNTPPANGLESFLNPTALSLKVTGNVVTSFTVPVTVTGGTATLGTDFTTPGGGATFNVTVPAGNYTSVATIPLGITIINDTLAESNETITFSIAASTGSSAYVTSSTTSCGTAPALTTSYTILDDDRPTISINKTRLGGTGTVDFGISGTNGVPAAVTNISTTANSVSTTVAALTNIPITTDGVAITFTETQPSTQWNLTAVSCIDANAGNAQLGNTNPGTNLATFSGNTVTIAAVNVLHTSAFNCSVTNTRVFADITLRKTWVDAVPNNAATVSATGLTDLLSVANTANETDSGTVQLVALGGVLTLSEVITTGVPGNYALTIACTGTSGLTGSTLTVGAADTAIVCTYTNKSIAVALTISKTDSKAFATSGGTNDYVISVSNAGPASADGVVVTDVVGSGLTCPAVNTVTCLVTAGAAVCPAGPLTFANLLTGITVVTFPNTGALQFAYTCNVN
jgi:trimeric autotransporter adhesin